jgi:hypothetical protein
LDRLGPASQLVRVSDSRFGTRAPSIPGHVTAGARVLAVLLFTGAMHQARHARANDLSFAWDAPAGCPRRDEVVARIDALTGAKPTGRMRDLSFEATVQRLGDGSWWLRVVRRSGTEQQARIVRGESCEAMADAAGVIVALALRQAAETEPSPRPEVNAATSSPPTVAPAPSPVLPARVAVRPQPAYRPAVSVVPPAPRVLLRAEVGLDRSTLRHHTATLFSLAGRQRLSRAFGLEIVTMVLLPSTVETTDFRASVSLATQGLRGCLSLGQGILVSSGCAVMEAGFVQAWADRAANGGFTFWWAAGLRLGLEARIAGPFRLGVAAEALRPLLEPALRVGDRRVYTLDRVAQRGWLGVRLDVP